LGDSCSLSLGGYPFKINVPIIVYFVAENLVLWARSETIGYAVNICHGMMEYWNVGMLGLAEWDLFL
jgi:hypothetical protein